MKKILPVLVDVLLLIGAVAICYGFGLASVPMGFIVGGLELVGAAWLLSKAEQ